MTTAIQLLLIYGMIVLLLGFTLGSVLGALRSKQPEVRKLALAHVETLMQGAMILGVAFAVSATGWDGTLATTGAALLVAGSAMQAAGVTLNWITKTGDQFAEKSPGFILNSLSSFASFPGLIILAFGIFTNL